MAEYKAAVRLGNNPISGIVAYRMLVAALAAEIKEKQAVLDGLLVECVKQAFIANWRADVKQVCISSMEKEDDDNAF